MKINSSFLKIFSPLNSSSQLRIFLSLSSSSKLRLFQVSQKDQVQVFSLGVGKPGHCPSFSLYENIFTEIDHYVQVKL